VLWCRCSIAATAVLGMSRQRRTDVQREALRIAQIRGQPVELLYEHVAAPLAPHTPTLELEVEPPVGGTDIANADRALVVATTAPMAAA
jgi:hypothetical protein